jgi:hypothetical protein
LKLCNFIPVTLRKILPFPRLIGFWHTNCLLVHINDGQPLPLPNMCGLPQSAAGAHKKGNAMNDLNPAGNDETANHEYLGLAYGVGLGVKQDYARAFVHFSLAATSGNENVAANRDLVAINMTPAQKAEAEIMLSKWRNAA